jgi:hypothetical protein
MKLRLVIAAMVSFMLAFPIGGFVFGFLHCNCRSGDFLGRTLIGAVFAILTPVSFGFPPKNEAGSGEPWNAWPHIAVSALVIFALLTALFYKLNGNKQRRFLIFL